MLLLAIQRGDWSNRDVYTAASSYPAEAKLTMINLIKNPVLLILGSLSVQSDAVRSVLIWDPDYVSENDGYNDVPSKLN